MSVKGSDPARKNAKAGSPTGRLSKVEQARLAAEVAAERELPLEVEYRLGREIPATGRTARAISGGEFIFDQAEDAAPPVWGEGQAILWAPGEALMICARQGVGKSTVMQQLALARIGIREPSLFALPVEIL